ncbi:MAG: hypothetical protein IE916_11770 [Epsilonproteobacteria bacterium]|nr:hypothetical protein [Campylobacterota bacterium]
MRKNKKVIHLFEESNTSSVKHVISIATEDDLNCFWDFLSNSNSYAYDSMHTFIAHFYNFAHYYLTRSQSHFFEIIIEESDLNIYFTLWNKIAAKQLFKLLGAIPLDMIYDKNRISVRLPKITKAQLTLQTSNEQRQEHLIASVQQPKEIKTDLEPYTFINNEDLEELLKLSEDMQDLILNLSKKGFSEHTFITFRSYLSIFCFTLRYYPQIQESTKTFTEFSNLLNMHKERFLQLSEDEFELIIGFVHNIDNWLQTLFVRGGAHLYFMDNSLKSDLATIQMSISPSETSHELSLDDIFHF